MPAEVAHISPPVPPPLPPGVETHPLPPPVERDPNLCANCDTPLQGPFCSQCGQHVRDLHRSTWRFVADFFENAFSWDNKLLRTLEPLLAQPGALTLDYLSGRRMRYVHPLRLFLFTSAICLTIIQYLDSHQSATHSNRQPAKKEHHRASVNFQFGDASPTPTPADGASPAPTAPADVAAPSPAATPRRHGDDDTPPGKDGARDLNQTVDSIHEAVVAAKEAAASAKELQSAGEGLGHRIVRKAETKDLSRVALALLPIFAVMLRSLYWRRDPYYFAHFVFSLHYHTFLLLFFAAYKLVQMVLPTSFWPVDSLLHLCLLLPGVYLFLALRRLYAEGRGRTAVKVCVLGAMHAGVLALGLNIVGA